MPSAAANWKFPPSSCRGKADHAVSPPKHALLDPPERRHDPPSAKIELATDRELAGEQTRHDRRAHKRHRDEELRWIRQARLSAGPAVSIVDLSSGGALVDSPVALRPDSVLTLEIEGRGFDKTLQFRVIRCEVGTLRPGQTIYRGACEFTTSIDLPAEHAGRARVLYPNQFVGVDVALEQLVERAGAGSAFGSLDAGAVTRTTAPLSAAVGIQTASELADTPAAVGWQKIVVRYVEGQVLKGYTQDFSAARAQFSLWPSLTASPSERVIVPLARLKGVFFVRDFAGNPGYIERSETEQSQHGRRIEVTLVDHEVIAGRTLTYRPDGHGFFVMPADPLANNIRVFIVASAVRQVRFP